MVEIHDDFKSLITTQSYISKTPISGVVLKEVPKFNDESGSFSEMVRFNNDGTLESFPDFKVEQASWSVLHPGGIKAFHLHYKQDDVWFVPGSESLLIGLHDIRKDSPTYGKTMRFMMGCGKSQLLRIPAGVLHGCANLSTSSCHLIYFVNQKFDALNPDEHRVPYNITDESFWDKIPG